MPNIRIDQLPPATLPLAGDEVAPVVQSGITSKVAISDIIGLSSAATTAFEPSGSIAATNVQDAIEELDADLALKAPIASPTFTGPVTLRQITGNFYSTPLEIRGNVGSTTEVLVSPPYPTGYSTRVTLAGASSNGLNLFMSDTGASLRAYYNQFLGTPIPLSLIAGYNASVKLTLDPSTGASLYTGTTEKLNIAQDATGTYTFNGTAPRIRGDMSNATTTNRIAFQTSTANGNTVVGAVPNGTGTASGYRANNAVDPDNASYGQISVSTASVSLTSGKTGSGAYIPLNLVANNVETLRLDIFGSSLHLNPAGGLGYGVGAGGTASQPGQNAGNQAKNLDVTMTTPVGQFTTGNASMLPNTKVRFTLVNTRMEANDEPRVWIATSASVNSYRVWVDGVGAGACGVILENYSGSTLGDSVVIGFELGKGSIS